MVGLYGVGGLGKTTLCKTMVNLYTSQYLGRSCLIEFPTNGDKAEIVRGCKMALKKLDNLSDRVLEGKDSFDEVIQLMKDRVTKYDVFLAIDNVWPKSEEEAERLLGVAFTSNSKILLTSRSEQVLRKVLFYHMKNSYICSLPTPSYEDALKIFQKSLKPGDLTSLQVQKQIETFVEGYKFDGMYHPLALKALAGHLWSLWDHGDTEVNSHDLACILANIDTTALQSLNDAIRLNYDGLPQHKKRMFLDIALWKPQKSIGFFYGRTIANAVQWLQLFFERLRKAQIKQCIRELRAAGVIQIEIDKHGDEMIGVHDLYFDLAQKEASSTGFLTLAEEAMEGMTCERLERLTLEGVMGDQCMKELQQPTWCGRLQLQLLYAANIEIWRTIHLPALRVLILERPRRGHSRISLNGLRSWDKLNLKGFIQLKFLSLQECDFVSSLETLSALCNLQMLHIRWCSRLQNLDGLLCLTKLEALRVEYCFALKKLPDLGGVTGLERLELFGNHALKEVSGRLGPALRVVSVQECRTLKEMPDLGGVTGLERVELMGNASLEEVSGRLSPTLKRVTVGRCRALRKLLDFGGVAGLERLVLYGKNSEEEVGLDSPKEPLFLIYECPLLTSPRSGGGWKGKEWDSPFFYFQDWRLQDLRIEEWDILNDVMDVGTFTNLRSLEVRKCGRLMSIIGLDALSKLEEVVMCECGRLEDRDGGVSALRRRSNLELAIDGCPLLS